MKLLKFETRIFSNDRIAYITTLNLISLLKQIPTGWNIPSHSQSENRG